MLPSFTRTARTTPCLAGAILCLAPAIAHAADGFSAASLLMLPFLLALAVGSHILLGRGAKALAAASSPLASGEMEIGGYERRVYTTADRAMLEIVGVVLAAGFVMWLGAAFENGWIAFAGWLGVLGAVGLDMARWERVTVSANNVWFQRGFGKKVHQVAIENIRDLTVAENDAPGFTLRYLNRNRICRINMRMNDKRIVALPKTDALGHLDAVETTANHIRTRLQLARDREATRRSSDNASKAAQLAASQPGSMDREMLRELKRLRQKAQAPDHVPPAVKKA